MQGRMIKKETGEEQQSGQVTTLTKNYHSIHQSIVHINQRTRQAK